MSDGPERNPENGRFVAGNSGNGGRPKGSRNKLGEAFIQALYEDFQEGGVEAIRDMRMNDTSGYVRVVAGVLPKEFALKPVEDTLTDEQLAAYIDALDGELARRAGQAGGHQGPEASGPVH